MKLGLLQCPDFSRMEIMVRQEKLARSPLSPHHNRPVELSFLALKRDASPELAVRASLRARVRLRLPDGTQQIEMRRSWCANYLK
jgi:hypothetical protein